MALGLSLVAISGPKKYRFSGPTPSNGPRNGFSPHQIHYVKRQVPTSICTFWYLVPPAGKASTVQKYTGRVTTYLNEYLVRGGAF
jgi:hypothetical protein